MYNQFFGFNERPFKLVPNPAYLFLSRCHEEALAHLTYAVSEGDGFVEITGEVGTGKTTLCRAFLETLDDNTRTAFIFNPKLDSIQLLKAINDEFGIDSTKDNVKDLVDVLNTFLMDQKRQGKKVVLLIDEAQNLTASVLEQLRLLSNLETTQDKLLQIILVGQPELGDLLDSHELRQLSQRINLSCHLTPFNKKETKAYIVHRINVASKKADVRFTRGAINTIYQFSRGIPRMINIVCDRALLTAFGLDKKTINKAITKTATRELSGRRQFQTPAWLSDHKAAFTLLTLVLILGVLLFPLSGGLDQMEENFLNKEVKPAAFEEKLVPETIPADPVSTENSVPDLIQTEKTSATPEKIAPLSPEIYFDDLNKTNSRQSSLSTVIELWGETYTPKPYLQGIVKDEEFFRLAAKQNGFLVHSMNTDFDLVKKLNLPAILQLYMPEGRSPFYIALHRMDEDQITLISETKDSGFTLKAGELKPFIGERLFIPWKNFYDYNGIIPLGSTQETIITLKMHLRDLGFDELDFRPVYDKNTQKVITSLQTRHGIEADGLVGPLTKIVLYNEMVTFNIPRIRK